jgi:hypothetical protein
MRPRALVVHARHAAPAIGKGAAHFKERAPGSAAFAKFAVSRLEVSSR